MTTNQMPNQPGQMHPQDKRNMILFFVICVLTFMGYDHFVQKPQRAALEVARTQAAAQAPVAGVIDTQSILSRADAVALNQRIAIDNPDLLGSISLKGGRLDDLSLRQYFDTVEKKTPVTLLSPARTDTPLYLDYGWLADAGITTKLPDANSEWRLKDGSRAPLSKDNPVTLTWANGQGLTFEKTYTLDDQYMFTVTQTVTNKTTQPVALHPYAALTRQGLPADFVKNAIMHEGPIGYLGNTLHETQYKDLDKKPRVDFTSKDGWAGFTDKYWFTGIIPADVTDKTFRFIRADAGAKPVYQIDMTGAPISIAPGASVSHAVRSFVGPKKLDVLDGYKETLDIRRFDLVIDFGMFWFLTIPFFHILTWLGHSIGSFAIAILVFTVILRLVVFPLANKSYRSFARMRKIQPEMVAIRERYSDDRVKLQQAIFELYKRENVNPMAGCLPLLLQIPIFFSLYKVLYITLEMRHAPFFGWIHDMSAPDPLSVFTLFGLIDWTPPSILQLGIWPIIMGVTLMLQQRLNPPMQDPTQAKVMQLMPIIITALMAHMPAGLVIYWSWSNCLSIVQQYVLMRQEGVEVSFFHKSSADKKMEEMVAHGPHIHPAAEEIAEDLEAIEGKIIEKTVTPPKKGGKKGKR